MIGNVSPGIHLQTLTWHLLLADKYKRHDILYTAGRPPKSQDWWILFFNKNCNRMYLKNTLLGWYLCFHAMKYAAFWKSVICEYLSKNEKCRVFYSCRLESSGRWTSMRQQLSFPGFFQARLYVNTFPKDTFIKLPVSRKDSNYTLRNWHYVCSMPLWLNRDNKLNIKTSKLVTRCFIR